MRPRPLVLCVSLLGGCPSAGGGGSAEATTADTGVASTSGTDTGSESTDPGTTQPTGETGDDTGTIECSGPGNLLDVVFVIDNAYGSMPEQARLLDGLPHLLTRLRGLEDAGGAAIVPDVNIMFTTTDLSHPQCVPSYKGKYYPAYGEPMATPCNQRLWNFDDYGDPVRGMHVCTDLCPNVPAAAPSDPFIHFAGGQHNIVDPDPGGDPVARALACLAPQGFVGCSFESPLEAMLQALDPNKPWNGGERPFLRDCATLAVVLISDETDCSITDAGYRYFDPDSRDDPEYNLYMEDGIDTPGVKSNPTSAVCWNASMDCDDADMDGIYESCVSVDRGVLQPTSRYTEFLRETLSARHTRPVVMLTIAGVPPTPGGADDLVYHDFTAADLLPGDFWTEVEWQHSFGIGPGCADPEIGYAMPPGRLEVVCEALDVADDPGTPGDETQRRCCIESMCRADYHGGFDCLADMLAQQLEPAAAAAHPGAPAAPH